MQVIVTVLVEHPATRNHMVMATMTNDLSGDVIPVTSVMEVEVRLHVVMIHVAVAVTVVMSMVMIGLN